MTLTAPAGGEVALDLAGGREAVADNAAGMAPPKLRGARPRGTLALVLCLCSVSWPLCSAASENGDEEQKTIADIGRLAVVGMERSKGTSGLNISLYMEKTREPVCALLKQALRDPKQYVRFSGRETPGQAAGMISLLQQGVAEVLARCKDAVPDLRAALAKTRSPEVKRAIIEALGNMDARDDETISALIAALKDGDESLEAATVVVLAKIPSDKAKEAVEAFIGGPRDLWAQAEALRALAKEYGAAVIPLLKGVLSADGVGRGPLQLCAVSILGAIRDPEAIKVLFDDLRHFERIPEIVDALVAKGPGALDPAFVALSDDEPYIRAGATFVLAGLDDTRPSTVSKLEKMAGSDPDPYVRAKVREVLGKIRGLMNKPKPKPPSPDSRSPFISTAGRRPQGEPTPAVFERD